MSAQPEKCEELNKIKPENTYLQYIQDWYCEIISYWRNYKVFYDYEVYVFWTILIIITSFLSIFIYKKLKKV